MWFKNCLVYPFSNPQEWDEESLNRQLEENAFQPCGKREPSQYGWVSPLGQDYQQLSHWGDGCFMICARKEERILPSAVVKEKLQDKVKLIEAKEDRRVYRKEQETLKEEIIHDCLPQAFTRSSRTFAYIDTRNHWLIIDSSSAGKAEALMSLLRNSIDRLPVLLPQVIDSPAVVMSHWLRSTELPQHLELGMECELREAGEDGGIIRCKNQDLHSEEISQHLNIGKQAVKVAVHWNDAIQFILAEDLSLKRIKFADTLVSQADDDAADGDGAVKFDADFALMSGQFAELIPQIFDWFGGTKESI